MNLKRIQQLLTWFKIPIIIIPINLKWLVVMIGYNKFAFIQLILNNSGNILAFLYKIVLIYFDSVAFIMAGFHWNTVTNPGPLSHVHLTYLYIYIKYIHTANTLATVTEYSRWMIVYVCMYILVHFLPWIFVLKDKRDIVDFCHKCIKMLKLINGF